MLLFIIIRFKKTTICTEKRQTLHKPLTRNPNPNPPGTFWERTACSLGPSLPIAFFPIRQRIRPSRRSDVVAGARPCLPGLLL